MIRPFRSTPLDSPYEEDIEIIRAALAREPGSIDLLIDRLRCIPRILTALNIEISRPLNPHDIEDLSQDTLLKVLDKLEEFEGRAKLETWVYRFCYLELMNRVRRESRRAVVPLEIEPEFSIEPGYDTAMEIARVERLLSELGPPRSEIIQLRHFEDLTFEEIGQILEMPANTAKTHYHRGIARLRRLSELERGKGRS